MIQQYSIIIPEFGELDTLNLDVSFNYNFDNLEEISERQTSYSKTIRLADTPRNARFFEHIFNLTIDNSYNTRKKVACIVRMGSDDIFTGYMKLKEVVNIFNNIYYDVDIISEAITLTDDIADDNLTDLDFSEYNHNRTKYNIEQSWDTLITKDGGYIPFQLGRGYVYGDIVYGNDDDIYDKRKVYDMFPGIYTKTIIDKIFDQYGFTYSSEFFNSQYFKKLIVPFSKDKLAIDEEEKTNRELYVGIASGASPLDIGLYSNLGDGFVETALNPINAINFTDESTVDFNDPGGNFNSSYFAPVKQGRYNISFNGKLKIEYSTDGGQNFEYDSGSSEYLYYMVLRRADGSEQLIDDSGRTSSNPFGILNITPSDGASHASPWIDPQILVFNLSASNLLMNPGDKVYVHIAFKFNDSMDWHVDGLGTNKFDMNANPFLFRDADGEFSYWKVELANNILMANEMVNMNQVLPDMRIKDFLHSLSNEFNLVFIADKDNERNFIIEPVEAYLKSNYRILNWTSILDRDEPSKITIRPTTDLVARNFKYTYAEDSDHYNEKYQDETNQVFGEQTVFTNNEFNKTTDLTSVSFAATPSAQRYFIDRITPWFVTIDADNAMKPKSLKPRMIFYNGLKNCNAWKLEDFENDPAPFPFTKYPQVGMYEDDMMNPTSSLEFGPSVNNYFTSNTFPNNNLYNLFHRNYLQSVIDKDAHILIGNFYLTSLDISTLDFRDIIYIDGVHYRILKINGYNPIAYDKTTEVELIKIIDYETYFENYSTIPVSNMYCPVDVQLRRNNGKFVYISASNQPITSMCCESLNGTFSGGVCYLKMENAADTGLNNVATESVNGDVIGTNTPSSPTTTFKGNGNYAAAGSKQIFSLGDNNTFNAATKKSIMIGSGSTVSGDNILAIGDNVTATESGRIYLQNVNIDGDGVITNNVTGTPVIFAATLADTLLAGNTTGASDITISNLQFIKYITQPALQPGFDDLTVVTKKFVDDSIAAIPVTPTSNLEDVLAVGNFTGASDIIVNDTQKITNTSGKVYQEFIATGFEQRTTDDLVTPTIINVFQNVLGYMAMQVTNAVAGNFSRIQMANTQLDIIASGIGGATLTEISMTDDEILMKNETDNLIRLTRDGLLIEKRYTPLNTLDPLGTQGQVTIDDDYVYVKTSVGWKRSALSVF